MRFFEVPTTGWRITIRMITWRFAPHNHADQADIGRQRLRLFCRSVIENESFKRFVGNMVYALTSP